MWKEDIIGLDFHIFLDHDFRKFQENLEGFMLNLTRLLLACIDDLNLLSGNIHSIKGKNKGLISFNREVGVIINTENSKLYLCLVN
jgi:hypothetical protein